MFALVALSAPYEFGAIKNKTMQIGNNELVNLDNLNNFLGYEEDKKGEDANDTK
ncbi:hypothetical protein RCS94_02475 [Orbaceae bacterium ac157xtp]